MSRKYTKIKELELEVFRMKDEGMANRKIAEHFGLTREQIRGLIKRHNRNEQTVNLVLNTVKAAMRKELITVQLQLHSDQSAICCSQILSPNTIIQHYAVNVKTRQYV